MPIKARTEILVSPGASMSKVKEPSRMQKSTNVGLYLLTIADSFKL